MKNKLIEAALLYCVISLLIGCNPKKEETITAPAIDKEQIKKEIQADYSAQSVPPIPVQSVPL